MAPTIPQTPQSGNPIQSGPGGPAIQVGIDAANAVISASGGSLGQIAAGVAGLAGVSSGLWAAIKDWISNPLRIIKLVFGLGLIWGAIVLTFLPDIAAIVTAAAGAPELAPAVHGALKRPKQTTQVAEQSSTQQAIARAGTPRPGALAPTPEPAQSRIASHPVMRPAPGGGMTGAVLGLPPGRGPVRRSPYSPDLVEGAYRTPPSLNAAAQAAQDALLALQAPTPTGTQPQNPNIPPGSLMGEPYSPSDAIRARYPGFFGPVPRKPRAKPGRNEKINPKSPLITPLLQPERKPASAPSGVSGGGPGVGTAIPSGFDENDPSTWLASDAAQRASLDSDTAKAAQTALDFLRGNPHVTPRLAERSTPLVDRRTPIVGPREYTTPIPADVLSWYHDLLARQHAAAAQPPRKRTTKPLRSGVSETTPITPSMPPDLVRQIEALREARAAAIEREMDRDALIAFTPPLDVSDDVLRERLAALMREYEHRNKGGK